MKMRKAVFISVTTCLIVLFSFWGGRLSVSYDTDSTFQAKRASVEPMSEPYLIRCQNETLQALTDYLATGSPERRHFIEAASQEREILASRIFRWFRLYACRGVTSEVRDAAENALLENPHYTLTVLRPLVLEDPMAHDDGEELYLSDAQPIYLNLCSRIASIEEDGFASRLLADIARTTRADIAKDAAGLLEFVNTSANYRMKSESYQENRQKRDLDWLAREKLTVDMNKDAVRRLLGKPDFDGGALWAYEGNGSYVSFLWLYFFDGALDAWDWGKAPPDGEEAMSKRLIRDR